MNIPTLMMRVAALLGHPVPISAVAAPLDDHDGERVEADASGQLRRPRGITVRRNVEYARRTAVDGTALRLRLDIMTPPEPGRHPLVVFVPGGGFVASAKAGGAGMRRRIAADGFVVASIEYRTTRHGATYREGVADVLDAVRFLRTHADEYGIDPDRVALWGESAGGYLAAFAGIVSGRPDFDPDGSAVQAVVDKFGGSDLGRLADGFDERTVAAVYAPGNPIARYVLGPDARLLDDDTGAREEADPVRHIRSDSPPFLLFHGTEDRVISPVQTMLLHDALRAAGVRSRRVLVRGAGHGDLAVRGGEERYWTTEAMMSVISGFLHEELAGQGSPQ